jgi:hypothetical protein
MNVTYSDLHNRMQQTMSTVTGVTPSFPHPLEENARTVAGNRPRRLLSTPFSTISTIIRRSIVWVLDSVVKLTSSYMALQPISDLGLLFMSFRNLTLIDGW